MSAPFFNNGNYDPTDTYFILADGTKLSQYDIGKLVVLNVNSLNGNNSLSSYNGWNANIIADISNDRLVGLMETTP